VFNLPVRLTTSFESGLKVGLSGLTSPCLLGKQPPVKASSDRGTRNIPQKASAMYFLSMSPLPDRTCRTHGRYPSSAQTMFYVCMPHCKGVWHTGTEDCASFFL
jgi:hypothetical protein